jgi:CheY-like chemotaxis protein
MHAIISMTHLIMRDGATPAQADRLEKIDHAARHLLSIINDILDISRIEAGKFTLEENVINLAHIASTVVTMLSDSAQAKGLRLIVDMEPGNVTYLGDRTRLTQAILNYVSNAIKFTDQGCITLRMRKLEEQDLKVLMHFEVRDTGKGIKPEALGKLFQPFEQGDNSLTREHGGTGLGLAITRRLAQFMGGTTGATSTPGAGSNFWLTAWLDKQTEPRQSDASPLQEDAEDYLNQHYKGCRVLVVDDDPINREVTKTLLGDIPFQVDLASDGEAAIAMAGRGNYDVILMDMQMPNLDGLGATRRIRALPDGGRVPIIAMTANAYADDRERCFESGMNDILIKPCEPADLFAMLLRWLPATSETRKLPH